MLIDEDGTKLGIIDTSEALKIADDKSLDLVQVSPTNADPVVCKILDYGKHIFTKKKINLLQKLKLKKPL